MLLDEIQLVPEFEDVLNSYLSMSKVDVFVTGSNAKFLSKDVITEFRGRGWEIRVQPLSFKEYYEAKRGDKSERIAEYYRYGGLPGVALLESPQEKEAYLKEVFDMVYLRDVVQRNHLKNADGLRELVRVLASAIGTSTNVKRIVNTFKSESGMNISPNTIAKYTWNVLSGKAADSASSKCFAISLPIPTAVSLSFFLTASKRWT